MRLVLCNEDHPEYGVATIPFPIPDDEYGNCISKLEALGIGGVTDSDCYVDQIEDAPPALDFLRGMRVNVDEVDFLARSMDRYTDYELAQFQALLHDRGYHDMMTIINLSFCCDGATVITDFSNLDAVGKEHYLNINGGSAPADKFDALNGEGIARDLISSGVGKVTPYGVLYDNGTQLIAAYTGKSFLPYLDRHYLVEIQLAPPPTAEEGTPSTMLYMPTPEKRLERLLERGEYLTSSDIHITDWMTEFPGQIQDCLRVNKDELYELNKMACAIEKLTKKELDTLSAAVLMAKPEYPSQIRHLAENLDQFEFIPNVKSAEALGRFMIQQSGHFEYDPNLEGFYDYAKYGGQRVKEQAGEFTELGYIGYTGTLSLEELMMEDPAEQYQREQEQGMGGIS